LNDNLEALDSDKTTELITQILTDERTGFLSSNCISEKPKAIMPTEFQKYVKEYLKIKDTAHLKLQLELYKKFKITNDLAPNKNILTQKQFEEFSKKTEKGEFQFWDWLDENCVNGYCSISKPIFNETFDLAYVQIGFVCGGLCGSGVERIYEFKNGKWIEKESFGGWVS